MRNSIIMGCLLLSWGAIAQIQEDTKTIQDLAKEFPLISVEAFERNQGYEKSNLSSEERTQRELDLLSQAVKAQVLITYEQKISSGDDRNAVYEEVKEDILNDIELADSAYRSELTRMSLTALDDVHSGGISNESQTPRFNGTLLKNIEERAKFLERNVTEENFQLASTGNFPSSSRAKDAERTTYNNKMEVLNSLVSGKENTKWVSTSSANHDLGKTYIADNAFKVQLKFKFLGTGLDAGPVITFTRKWGANAVMMYEGMEPPIDGSGHFSVFKKDFDGNTIVKNGQKQRRFMAFYCSAFMQAESTYKGEATVSFNAGVFASSNTTGLENYHQETSTLTSRRIYIPETIAGKIVTADTLREICHRDFLNAQIRRGLTVKKALNLMMLNTLKNLAFSHPKSKCASDVSCIPWFRKLNLSTEVKSRLKPRCVEHAQQKFRFCTNKGTVNTNCEVFKNGKSISPSMLGGYTQCDNGLKCVATGEPSWFKPTIIGVCRPAR